MLSLDPIPFLDPKLISARLIAILSNIYGIARNNDGTLVKDSFPIKEPFATGKKRMITKKLSSPQTDVC